MRKRGRTPEQEEKRIPAEYYRLNTKAVEDLVTADASNSPEVSRKELNRYRSGPKIRIRDGIKAFLIKWWFAGAVCFFFLWGLGNAVPNRENQLLILGLALGFVTDLLVNNLFRFYARTPGANDRWMMVPKKGFVSLPLNLVYAFIILACVVGTYHVVNTAWLGISGQHDTIPLGVGPILFGVFAAGWDLVFLGFKRLFLRIVEDAKKQTR